MKRENMKKLLLGLGVLVTTVTPIIAVVSCGSSDSKISVTTDNGDKDKTPPTDNGDKDKTPPTDNGDKDKTPPTDNGDKDKTPPTDNGDKDKTATPDGSVDWTEMTHPTIFWTKVIETNGYSTIRKSIETETLNWFISGLLEINSIEKADADKYQNLVKNAKSQAEVYLIVNTMKQDLIKKISEKEPTVDADVIKGIVDELFKKVRSMPLAATKVDA